MLPLLRAVQCSDKVEALFAAVAARVQKRCWRQPSIILSSLAWNSWYRECIRSDVCLKVECAKQWPCWTWGDMEKPEANVGGDFCPLHVGCPLRTIVSRCFLSADTGLRAGSEPCSLPLSVAVHTWWSGCAGRKGVLGNYPSIINKKCRQQEMPFVANCPGHCYWPYSPGYLCLQQGWVKYAIFPVYFQIIFENIAVCRNIFGV